MDWRIEREKRMQERREREDKEREEAYKSLEDLPPLKPIVEDGQIPGTSGIRSSVELRTPPPIYEYEELDPSEYEDESDKLTRGGPSLRERPEFGEEVASKGKSGNESSKKSAEETPKPRLPDTPVVELMNKEEKEMWQLRYVAADAIMKGLEAAKKAEGVGKEEVQFFRKLAFSCDTVENERVTQSSVRIEERIKQGGEI